VGDRALTNALRTRYRATFMLNGHTAPQPAGPTELQLVEKGTADLISYGALFLAVEDVVSPRTGFDLMTRKSRTPNAPRLPKTSQPQPRDLRLLP
jgi:hypothetical protein